MFLELDPNTQVEAQALETKSKSSFF